MKARDVVVEVTDHAVIRWLERDQGIDIDAMRAHLAARAIAGAELGATAVQLGKVRLILRDNGVLNSGLPIVTVVTASPRFFVRNVG
jgi:hypothetical protein